MELASLCVFPTPRLSHPQRPLFTCTRQFPLPTAHCPLPTRDATCDHLLIIRRHRRLFTGHWSLATGHSRRHSPLTAGRKSGSFSCSISPFFVLSANIHWINARAIWLRFSFSRRRRLPSAFTRHWPLARRNDPLLSRRHRCLFVFTGHWPLTTGHWPPPAAHRPPPTAHCPPLTAHCPLPTADCRLPTRHSIRLPSHQRGQIVRRPSPAGHCLSTDPEFPKSERCPISPTKPSLIFHR
jgi:hypothetical protein